MVTVTTEGYIPALEFLIYIDDSQPAEIWHCHSGLLQSTMTNDSVSHQGAHSFLKYNGYSLPLHQVGSFFNVYTCTVVKARIICICTEIKNEATGSGTNSIVNKKNHML